MDGAQPWTVLDTAPADGAPLERGEAPRIGRFTVLGRLGAGAAGVVYAAYDPRLDRKVAVKLLQSGDRSASDDAWQPRLLREAQALAKLSHPNVVQIHEVGVHDGEVYVAMEFVTGVTLRTWLSGQRRGWREVVEVFVQAGRGLAAAHAAGLVHRDFKPENALVGADGRVRVVDFGLVRFDAEDHATTQLSSGPVPPDDPQRTAQGVLVGTPAYMSPEQYRGRPADALSDQFGFCVALYEALFGERPFAGATALELSHSVLRGQVRVKADHDLPRWLVRAVLRGLAVDAAQRWPDMPALLLELSRERGRGARRARWAAALVALGVTSALAALLGWSALRGGWARDRAEVLAAERLAAAQESIDALLDAGRRSEAAAVLDAFVAVPEHRGTRALTRAFQAWGARMRAAGDLDAARMAHAQAYAAADDLETEQAVLGDLARLFHEQWSWEQLTSLCAGLQRQPGGGPDAWAGLCAEAALARRDLLGYRVAMERGAASAELQDLAPLISAWEGARRTELDVDAAGALDGDGDGRSELYLHSRTPAPGRLELVRADADLTPVRGYTLPGPLADRPGVTPLSLGTGEPAIAFTWSAAHRRVSLSAIAPGLLAELASVPSDEPLATAAADLDGDGAREIYLGTGPYGRQLVALRRESSGTWRIDHPHPGTDATNSDINAIVAADLDGDGAEELAVAAGAWRAFDVRVLRPGEGGELELVAREKLGDVAALATLRDPRGEVLLVAAKTDAYPSRIAFSPDQPAGPPAGIYFLRLRGRSLAVERFVPAPRRAGAARPLDVVWMQAADIDGDGRDDLVVRVREPGPRGFFTWALRQRGDGSFAGATLGGLDPLALAQLDDDAPLELLARASGPDESALWLLGVGAAPIEPLQSRHAPPAAVPAEVTDPLLARSWRRAEQLAALGLSSEAARTLDDLANLVGGAPERAAARLRAAQLYEVAGEYEAAAELFEQVAETGGAAALQGAARCYEQGLRFVDALRATRALLARETLPRAEAERVRGRLQQLEAVVEGVEVTELRFDQPLRAPWRVEDPTSVRQDLASGHLQVEAFAGQGPLARVPFTWSGGPLGLRAELALQRAEWGSGVQIGLRPVGRAGDVLLAVGVEVLGGGGVYTRRSFCRQPGARDRDNLLEEPGDDPARTSAVALSFELIPELDLLVCAVEREGQPPLRRSVRLSELSPLPGRYELVLLPNDFTRPSGLWASAAVRRISVRGAQLSDHFDAPSDLSDEAPRDLAARLLAQGESEAALAVLQRLPDDPTVRLWRAVALSELGRWPEASEALRLSLPPGSDEARGGLMRLLRTRRATFAPLVRSAFGPEYFRLFWEANEPAVQHHRDPLIQRSLTTALSDLVEFRPAAEVPDDTLLKVRLLLERGRAWSHLGQQQRARDDLAAAAELAGRLPPDLQDSESRALYEIDYERAALEASAGQRDAALEHTRRALRRAPARELAADRMRFDPRFRPLAEDVEWASLLGS